MAPLLSWCSSWFVPERKRPSRAWPTSQTLGSGSIGISPGQGRDTPTNMCGVALGGMDFAAAFLLCFLQGLNEPGDPPLQRNSLRVQQVLLMLLGGWVIALGGFLGSRRGLGFMGGDVGGELFS